MSLQRRSRSWPQRSRQSITDNIGTAVEIDSEASSPALLPDSADSFDLLDFAHYLNSYAPKHRFSESRSRFPATSATVRPAYQNKPRRSTQQQFNRVQKERWRAQSKGSRSPRKLMNNKQGQSNGENATFPRRLSNAATVTKQSTTGTERSVTRSMSSETSPKPTYANLNEVEIPEASYLTVDIVGGRKGEIKAIKNRASVVGEHATDTDSTAMLTGENIVQRAETRLKAVHQRIRWAKNQQQDAERRLKEAEEQIKECKEELEMAEEENVVALGQIWRAVARGDPYALERYPVSTTTLDQRFSSHAQLKELVAKKVQPTMGALRWRPLSPSPKAPQSFCSLM